MEPQCSVIVPTYNRSRYLPRALQSVLASGLRSAEVIVVDDGSPDDTEQAVRPYLGAVEYIRVQNGGASRARNVGIERSKGRCIAFLDDDDVYLPGMHQRMLDVLETHSSVAVVFGDVLVNDRQVEFARGHRDERFDTMRGALREVVGEEVRLLDRHKFLEFQLLKQNAVLVQAAVVRRSAVRSAGGFDESLTGFEEWELFTRLAAANGFAYLDRPVCRVEKHDSNMSSQLEAMVGNAVRIREGFLSRGYPVSDSVRQELARLWREVWFDWAMQAWRRDSPREARTRLKLYVRRFGFGTKPLLFMGASYLPGAWIRAVRHGRSVLVAQKRPR